MEALIQDQPTFGNTKPISLNSVLISEIIIQASLAGSIFPYWNHSSPIKKGSFHETKCPFRLTINTFCEMKTQFYETKNTFREMKYPFG